MYNWLKILVKYVIRKTLMQFPLSAPSSPTPHEHQFLTKREIPQNIIKGKIFQMKDKIEIHIMKLIVNAASLLLCGHF
jgi:hypothetical protein